MKNKKEYDSKITKEDKAILGDKTGNLRQDGGQDKYLKNRLKEVDFSGNDLDIPGRKPIKKSKNTSLNDEENKHHSLGSAANENLEQNIDKSDA
ncbi:hypothetical protein [Hwangdonia lutea]|uniref:Uncharacterized protein n=1 Tax=Hwangdonia lutea TaxID=3075823 RepID=A0AA97EKR1_9FLAO|nr:hypothetical protein [Hwangdonia sp. SCSIO 19198]WOD43032.1 hypothetical protein RNZ46_13650 [Hwangdonia sp. SCSIO 19198]